MRRRALVTARLLGVESSASSFGRARSCAGEEEVPMVDEPVGSSDADYAGHDRAFAVSPTQRGGAAILSVRGDVDALTAPELTQAIVAALDNGPSTVIVDLSDVAFLASAGMSVLVEAHER